MKPKTKQLLSVNNAWLFLSPHQVICYERPAKCGAAYSITRCRASEKSKVIALGWSVWWIKNWLCSLCGGARSDGNFSNSLTMGLCALRRKCSVRKRRSSVSSVPSECRASANSTCLPISARPWLHRGAISRSSAMTVNQKWQKIFADKFSRCVGGEWLCKHISCQWISSGHMWHRDGSKNAKLIVRWLIARSSHPWTRFLLAKG